MKHLHKVKKLQKYRTGRLADALKKSTSKITKLNGAYKTFLGTTLFNSLKRNATTKVFALTDTDQLNIYQAFCSNSSHGYLNPVGVNLATARNTQRTHNLQFPMHNVQIKTTYTG